MRKLKTLTIKNFKSIFELSIDIPQFAVIVGNNSVGKTNLLKAINLISLLAQGSQINSAIKELNMQDDEVLFDPNNPTFSFDLEIELDDKQIRYTLEISRSPLADNSFQYHVVRELLTNGKNIIDRTGSNISIEASGVLPEITGDQTALSIYRRLNIVSDVQRFLSSMKVDSYHVMGLRNPGTVANVIPGLDKNLAEKLYYLSKSIPASYQEIVNEAIHMITGLEGISIDENGGKLTISFKELSVPNKFSAYSSSDGNLRLLGILTSIIGQPKPSVVFIDEIENSMHPRRIKAIIKFLNYLSEKDNNGIQIIFTTHSPVVLRCVNDKEIIYMYRINGKTTISKPYNHPKVLEYLQHAIKKDSDTDLGELFETGALEEIFKLGIEKVNT